MIDKLVISGGGPTGIQMIGCMHELVKHNVLQLESIRHIFAVSIGTLIGVLIALKFDLETIIQYIVERPWENVSNVSLDHLLNSYFACGLVDNDYYGIFFKPFFQAKDISMEITLSELFAISNIHLHIYTVDINSYTQVSICHESHPQLKVLTALQMSSAIPMIISPVIDGDRCFIDGGIINNYPLRECIAYFSKDDPEWSEKETNMDTLFGFVNINDSITNQHKVTDQTNIFQFLSVLLNQFINNGTKHVDTEESIGRLNHEVLFTGRTLSCEYCYEMINSKQFRKELIAKGKEEAEKFLSTAKQTTKTESL